MPEVKSSDFSLTLLENVVENIPSAVFLKDITDGFRVKLWNNSAEKIFEISKSEIIGKTTHELWDRELADLYTEADLKVAREGKAIFIEEEPCFSKSRGEFFVRTQKIPLRAPGQKETKYLLCICDDITEQKAAAKKAKELLNQLEEAQKVAKIGSWSYSIESNDLLWSSEHYNIFEISEPQPQEVLFQKYRDKIYKEDLASLDAHMEKAIFQGTGFIFNHRIKMDSGKVKFVRGIANVTKN